MIIYLDGFPKKNIEAFVRYLSVLEIFDFFCNFFPSVPHLPDQKEQMGQNI